MTSKEIVLSAMRSQGMTDALDLRQRSPTMTGTEIIAEKQKIPMWDATKDYSEWAMGAPVVDGGVTYTLLQPHDASHYPDTRPATLSALWSPCHTTDPLKAEPYVVPNGTSGLYMKDECCIKDDHVWRSTQDNNPYPPNEVGTESFWEDLGLVSGG